MTDTTAPSAADAAFAAAKAESLGAAPAVPVTPPAGAPAAESTTPNTGAPTDGQEGFVPPATQETPPVIGEPETPGDEGLEATGKEGEAVVYTPTGDAAMDVALGFIGKLGILPTDPAMVEAGKGNFAFLEAKLAAMGDKATGWQQMVALGKSSYEGAVTAAKANATAINTAVLSVVGKQETLDAVLAWAGKTASKDEKAYFNAQLSESPLAARVAATELMRLYQGSKGTVIDPPRVTNGEGGNNAAPVLARLTNKEYAKEVDALARRLGGGNLNNSPEYAALNARYRNQR